MLRRVLGRRPFPTSTRNGVASYLQRRNLVPAPLPGGPPLMERRADRELPDVHASGRRWLTTAPVFLAILVSSALAIFNYQKSSSSVVSSTLYALRMSPEAREFLGDEIYFAHQMPWIWGELNQLHGRIDIQFEVKGTKNSGTMRFTSHRPTRRGMFETSEWSLQAKGGTKIDLLHGDDPFRGIEMDEDEPKIVGRGSYSPNLST